MKTNPLTSKFDNLLGTQASRLRASMRFAFRKLLCKFRRFPYKFESFLFLAFFVWLFLLVFTSACKSPAILTNTDDHHSRDSNYHANYERIETHDTIIIGCPGAQASSPAIRKNKNYPRDCKGNAVLEPFVGGNLLPDFLPLVKISDRTRTIHDTTYILQTDTLLRTQTITHTERYIPPFYKFCTITLASLASLATLYFSIRLLFRYLKIRSPT